MKKYTIPKMDINSFSGESVLTASGKTESELIVTQMLEEQGATDIKSVSLEDLW